MPGGVSSVLNKIRNALHFTPSDQREGSQLCRAHHTRRDGTAVADAWGGTIEAPNKVAPCRTSAVEVPSWAVSREEDEEGAHDQRVMFGVDDRDGLQHPELYPRDPPSPCASTTTSTHTLEDAPTSYGVSNEASFLAAAETSAATRPWGSSLKPEACQPGAPDASRGLERRDLPLTRPPFAVSSSSAEGTPTPTTQPGTVNGDYEAGRPAALDAWGGPERRDLSSTRPPFAVLPPPSPRGPPAAPPPQPRAAHGDDEARQPGPMDAWSGTEWQGHFQTHLPFATPPASPRERLRPHPGAVHGDVEEETLAEEQLFGRQFMTVRDKPAEVAPEAERAQFWETGDAASLPRPSQREAWCGGFGVSDTSKSTHKASTKGPAWKRTGGIMSSDATPVWGFSGPAVRAKMTSDG